MTCNALTLFTRSCEALLTTIEEGRFIFPNVIRHYKKGTCTEHYMCWPGYDFD